MNVSVIPPRQPGQMADGIFVMDLFNSEQRANIERLVQDNRANAEIKAREQGATDEEINNLSSDELFDWIAAKKRESRRFLGSDADSSDDDDETEPPTNRQISYLKSLCKKYSKTMPTQRLTKSEASMCIEYLSQKRFDEYDTCTSSRAQQSTKKKAEEAATRREGLQSLLGKRKAPEQELAEPEPVVQNLAQSKEARKAEEAKKKAEEAEEKRKQRLKEARKAEERKVEEAKKKAEEVRKEEAAKKAEKARKSEEANKLYISLLRKQKAQNLAQSKERLQHFNANLLKKLESIQSTCMQEVTATMQTVMKTVNEQINTAMKNAKERINTAMENAKEEANAAVNAAVKNAIENDAEVQDVTEEMREKEKQELERDKIDLSTPVEERLVADAAKYGVTLTAKQLKKLGIVRLHEWFRKTFGKKFTNVRNQREEVKEKIFLRMLDTACKQYNYESMKRELFPEKEVEEDYRIKYKDCVGKRISHESSWMTGTGVITKITKCSIQFKLDGFDTIKTVRENFKIDMSTEAVDTVDTVPDHNNTLRKKEGREVDV